MTINILILELADKLLMTLKALCKSSHTPWMWTRVGFYNRVRGSTVLSYFRIYMIKILV